MEGPRYRLIERLGQGGMATVWRAEDQQLRRAVAVKVLLPFVADRPEAQERFEREARALATVRHPNVLEVYDFVHAEGEEPARLVLELISGPSLQRFVVDSGALLPEVAALVAAELGAGLAAVHERGVVHRDVKPENVLIDLGQGRVVLTDFGVARVAAAEQSALTQTGAILGSPAYMSPEQARGDVVDARSDQFSLGSLVYWLSTGVAPFSGSHPLAIMQKLERGDLMPLGARNPRVPAWLERVVARCLSRSPGDRFPDMRALVDALRSGLADDGLGDPAVELRAYFADPPAFNGALRERVVTARLADARKAWREGRRSRAVASALRVLQLEPGHVEAQRFVDRRDRSRAALAIAALLAVAAPIAMAARMHRAPRPIEAPTIAVAQTRPDLPPVEAVVAAPIERAHVEPAPAPIAHESRHPRPKAAAPETKPAVPPPAVAPVEAAPTLAPRATTTTAVLRVRTSPWCDLVVDGAPTGRTPQAVTLPIGPHHVVCENPSGARLERDVVLAGDQEIEERLAVDALVTPRLAAGETYALDDGVPRTGPTRVASGRHRVTVVHAGAQPETRWIDVPARGCALGTDLRCGP